MAKGRTGFTCWKAEQSAPGPLRHQSRECVWLNYPWHKDSGTLRARRLEQWGFPILPLPNSHCALSDLLHTVCKDHDEPWLLHHVIAHVLVLAGHHHNSLLARDALGHVVLIVAPVHLSGL